MLERKGVRMQDIVAGISDIMLDIEYQLKNQIGCQPLPFPGMDSKYTTNNDALDNYSHYYAINYNSYNTSRLGFGFIEFSTGLAS